MTANSTYAPPFLLRPMLRTLICSPNLPARTLNIPLSFPSSGTITLHRFHAFFLASSRIYIHTYLSHSQSLVFRSPLTCIPPQRVLLLTCSRQTPHCILTVSLALYLVVYRSGPENEISQEVSSRIVADICLVVKIFETLTVTVSQN